MQVVTILKQVDLFRGLSEAQLQHIGQIAQEENFAKGDTIFQQDDHADKMYIISDGQVEVIIEQGDGQRESLVFLGTGQIVGEMTLVDEGRRSATVMAVDDMTTVFSISNTKFTDLCQSNTDIGYTIMRNIAQDMSFKLRHYDLAAKDN